MASGVGFSILSFSDVCPKASNVESDLLQIGISRESLENLKSRDSREISRNGSFVGCSCIRQVLVLDLPMEVVWVLLLEMESVLIPHLLHQWWPHQPFQRGALLMINTRSNRLPRWKRLKR